MCIYFQPGFEDDSNTDHTPVVRYCAVSAIEHSHKSAVSDLQWVPDHMEVGTLYSIGEYNSNTVLQKCKEIVIMKQSLS